MRKILIVLAVVLLLVGSVSAATLSVQLKRTNPGIAGTKSATLIYDVVNMDTEYMMKGFIVCQSPDDARVSSSYGAGTGTGAQYVSPFITMDTAPYQSSMTLTIDADSVGDKNAGCIFKYIPYKEVTSGSTTAKEPFTWEGSIDSKGKDVSGFIITMTEFTEAVADDAATTDVVETALAKAKIKVDDEVKDLEVGKTSEIKGIQVTLVSASDSGAEIKVEGEKTVTVTAGQSQKVYLKMNGDSVTELKDMYYRELRLDKSVPFVADMSDPQCPQGKEHCTASEVIDIGGMKIPMWAIIVGVLVVILLIAYLLGKTSRS